MSRDITSESSFDEPPMEGLLSHTSGIRERHGELAGVVGQLDVVTCKDLIIESRRTMREYFAEAQTPLFARQQMQRVAHGVLAATSATMAYLEDETLPKIDADAYFPKIELKLCDEEGSKTDATIRGVLGRIGVGGYFDHGVDNRTYLFRLSTGNPDTNVVAELHRTRAPEYHAKLTKRMSQIAEFRERHALEQVSATDKHVDVTWHMSIAGYDVPQ